MTKQEFETLLGQEVDQDAYAHIEYVYNWHPGIPEVGGKQKIADLFKVGGMGVIGAMMETAQFFEELENEFSKLRAQRDEITRRIQEIQNEIHRVRLAWNGSGNL